MNVTAGLVATFSSIVGLQNDGGNQMEITAGNVAILAWFVMTGIAAITLALAVGPHSRTSRPGRRRR